MNGHGQQVLAPYSVRPRAAPTVATPLRWDELDERLDPENLTLDEVMRRLERYGDLFAGVLAGGQDLSRAIAEAT